MQFEEERVFNDIKEMLTPIYPNIVLLWKLFLNMERELILICLQ